MSDKPRYDVLTGERLPDLSPELQTEWDKDYEYLLSDKWPMRDMPTELDYKRNPLPRV